jgi:hypothetical protein
VIVSEAEADGTNSPAYLAMKSSGKRCLRLIEDAALRGGGVATSRAFYGSTCSAHCRIVSILPVQKTTNSDGRPILPPTREHGG